MNETTPLAALVGARVRRVDLPSPTLVALSLALGEARPVLVVSLEPRAVAVGLMPERPKGDPAAGFATFLRTHVEGSALVRTERAGTALGIVFSRETGEVTLYVEPAPNLVAVRSGKILGAHSVPRLKERGLQPGSLYVPPTEGKPIAAGSTFDALFSAGDALTSGRDAREESAERTAFLRAIQKERARVERRLVAVEKDAARADEAPALRDAASALLAHASQIHAERTERTLDLDGVSVTLPASTAPAEHAQALYARAKKAEAARVVATERAAEAKAELARLDAVLARADGEGADLEALARSVGVKVQAPTAGPKPKEERLPYRTFHGHAGRAILVGRGPRDNDHLTTKVARPHDLWLHVRGAHGSHVVVPLERGESCPAELLVDAAHLAVRFSELEGTTDADVTYVEKRHVRKPKGSAPGGVIFERDKTLALRVEPDRLERLLRPAKV